MDRRTTPIAIPGRHCAAVLTAAFAGAVALPAQSFPCEKYTLDNGLTVILRVDRALPQVAINTWYRVGSKDEPPGRSGFAHLFEHLMFMGTERVPGNQFDVLMEQGGGSNNASTTEDRTNYYAVGPSSLLSTLLWLDADRLEDLGRTMTQDKLDRQRDIVRNEIRQNVENTPYGRANERVYRLMFPAGHPYHEAVYGTHADLEAATVGDVKDFFATYYVPDNASLVIAGDFDPAQVKPLVQSLFGTLPRGGAVTRRTVPAATLPGLVRQTMLDRVQLPLVRMVWHSPAAFADGDAEMALLAQVLTAGKTSRLYQRMVFAERIATDVSAWQDSLQLGSMFSIAVTAAPGADLDRIERTIDEELARIREQGIDAGELAQKQTAFELGQLARLQDLGAVADQLNQYEFAWGEPDSFARDLDRFRRTTPQRVQRVAAATLAPDHRVILRVLPEQGERSASARDQRPADPGTAPWAAPTPTTFALGNGIPVHLWTRTELPLVAMQVLFSTGAVLTDPRTAGVGDLTAAMLLEGAGDLDALAFADAMQALGARYRTGTSHEAATASLTVLRRNLDRGAELLALAVRRPRLQTADWERSKALHLEQLRQADDDPGTVAERVGLQTLLGRSDPYAWSTSGTAATVTPLQLDDVRREYARVYTPRQAAILIAGDLTAAAAKELLERTFGDWSTATAAAPVPAPTPAAAATAAAATAGPRVVLVHRDAAVQTVVRFYAPGPVHAAPTRLAHEALATVLGGSFTSRLNQNLREQHGFTYGARAGYVMGRERGWFAAGADVRSDVTGAAIAELLRELQRIGGGERADVTSAELGKAAATLRSETVQSFGSLGGILGNAGTQLLYQRPFTATADDLAQLDQLTTEAVNALGRAAVAIDRGVLVLVGDRAAITAQLAGLPLPAPIERDVHGEPAVR